MAETAISAGLPINQDDSAAKIASALHNHRETVLVAVYLSIVYAVAFAIYLAKLHELLRGVAQPSGAHHSLVLIGGVLLVVRVIQSRVLPRWLAWISFGGGILLFLQGFGLGGIIGTYGLVLDLIGYLLFLLFVLLGSAIMLRDHGPASVS